MSVIYDEVERNNKLKIDLIKQSFIRIVQEKVGLVCSEKGLLDAVSRINKMKQRVKFLANNSKLTSYAELNNFLNLDWG